MKVKKILSPFLALVMLLAFTATASAAAYVDIPVEGHWSREAVQAAVDNGLFHGDNNGLLHPERDLSRAELAKVVVAAFGASESADISAFTDVSIEEWYCGYVAKAVKMGIMCGSDGAMRPTEPVSRQEAFTVLARALKLGDGTIDDLAAYSDASDVASWSIGPVAAMVKAGYVSGSNNRLNPAANISRAELAQVMHNIFAVYITEAGTFTEVSEGNVIVNTPDVILKDCTIQGDLMVGDGVGNGDLTLDNVRVNGRLVVRGGGANSVHVINNSEISADVIVSKVDGNVRVYADVTSEIRVVTVEDGQDNVIIEGTVGVVSVSSSDTPVVLRNATVTSVEVTAPSANVTLESSKVNSVAVSAANAKVELTGTTTVTTVQVDAAAEGSTVTAEANTKITTIKADADVTVNGSGKVENTQGEGKVADSQGKEIVTTPAPTPSEPDPEPSIPAVHTHVWATEWSTDEYHHWHACIWEGGCTARADEGTHSWRDGECVCGRPLPTDEHEHIWGEWQPDDGDFASTMHFCLCTVEGCTYRRTRPHTMGSPNEDGSSTCTECGYTRQMECADGHTVATWSLYYEDYHKGTCSVCNEVVVEEHAWGPEVNGKITCTAPGCGAMKNVSCEHEWVNVSSTATCTEDGELLQRCSMCGLERTVSDSAKGHSWGEPFEGEDGKHYHTCPSCNTTEEVDLSTADDV